MAVCVIVDNCLKICENVQETSATIKGRVEFDLFGRLKAAAESFCVAAVKRAPVLLVETANEGRIVLSYFGDPITVLEDAIRNLRPQERSVGNYSYPISHVMTVVNKYRIKNGTDTFGYGRQMSHLEPVDIYFFTTCQCAEEGGGISVSKTPGTGGEMVDSPIRWDHRFHCILVHDAKPVSAPGDGDDSLDLTIWTDLVTLSNTSGGRAHLFGSLRQLKTFVSKLLEDLHAFGCSVGFQLVAGQSTISARLRLSATVAAKTDVIWPIPENDWVDGNSEFLRSRTIFPRFQVERSLKVNTPASSSESRMESVESFLRLAFQIGLPVNLYEVSFCETAEVPVTKGLKLKPQHLLQSKGVTDLNDVLKFECGFIRSPGSGRRSSNALLMLTGSEQLEDPAWGMIISSGALTNLLNVSIPLNGYFLASLPFNFPALLPLLKAAINHSSAASLAAAAQWVPQWRKDVELYLSTVPPYYNSLLSVVFKRLQVSNYLAPLPEFVLHRGIVKHVEKYQMNAKMDVFSTEQIAQFSRPNSGQSRTTTVVAIEKALDQKASCCSMEHWELPEIANLTNGSLIGTWENMRRTIFGGPTGLTVRGLSVGSGVEGTGGVADSSTNLSQWVQGSLYCNRLPHKTTRNMGNFIERLCRQEARRDFDIVAHLVNDANVKGRAQSIFPLSEDAYHRHIEHEDSLHSLRSRKLVVNFGNRFKIGQESSGIAAAVEKEIDGKSSMLFDTVDDILEAMPNEVSRVINDSSENSFESLETLSDTPRPEWPLSPASMAEVDDAAANQIYGANGDSNSIRLQLPPLKRKKTVDAKDEIILSSTKTLSESSSFSPENSAEEVAEEVVVIASNEIETKPSVWTEQFSSRFQRIYWYNTATGESSWVNPG